MKRLIILVASAAYMLLSLVPVTVHGQKLKLNMVFVPASEKGDEKDYVNLIKIIGNLSGYTIKAIKVTDYNAAVEAMRAGRAQIAWFGAKTYILAVEIAGAEAFAAGVRKGDKDATYLTYFVVRSDSPLKKLGDVRGKHWPSIPLVPPVVISFRRSSWSRSTFLSATRKTSKRYSTPVVTTPVL